MKKIRLLAGALLVIGFTACSDDLDVKREVPVTGEEVAFGTSLRNFEMPQSRTIYGVPDDGESSVEKYKELTINWKEGDKVRVYSPQATAGFQSADYVIDEETEGGNAHYFLVKDSHNDTGVRWGDVNTLHRFYAFYPTNINRNNYTPIKGLGKDGIDPMTVEAVIPVAQEKGELVEAGNEDRNIGNITLPAHWKLIRPDMTYAIMAGHGTWDPESATDKNVTINFKPIVTVVDVVVNGPEDGANSLDVYRVTINSKKTPIVGKFTAQFAENGDVTFGGMSETVTENNNMATINCQYNGKPTTLGPGEKLTLKFFLLPRDIDASELSVTVQINEGRVLTKSLVASGGTDKTLKQGEIVRVWTPKLTVPKSSNWMSSIPENVLFSQLSLPGSKHSYTGDLYNQAVEGGEIDENGGIMQYYQSIYVSDKTGDPTRVTQFDKGIRAFDLKIYNGKMVPDGWFDEKWDGINHVYAGGASVGDLAIGDVLTNLKNQMAESDSKDEACVVMLNYVSPPDISTWLSRLESGLNDWNTANPGILQRIDPAKTTMGDMRGKIAVIINVPDNTTGSNYNFVNYIYGFSSSVQNLELQNLKLNDNQSVRMQNLYQVNNPDFETATAASPYAFRAGAGLVPYYITEQVILNGKPSSYYDLIGRKEEMMNDLFDEMRTESYSSLVINDLAGFCVTKNAGSTGSVDWGKQTWTRHYWPSNDSWDGGLTTSYDFVNVDMSGNETATFKWDVTPSGQEYGNTWFRLTGGRDLGQGGNTVAFARLFNPVALNAVYNMVEHGRVPMGIVLMNFAGTDKVKINGANREVLGEQLPSTIMSNNFMFSLKTGTTTTKSSSDTSYPKEGNVWD